MTKRKKKPRVAGKDFEQICQRIAEGEPLTKICETTDSLPSWRTVLKYVREDEDAYQRYREAHQIQAEVMRDQIITIVEKQLPDEPKLAMAEVQRRRLEADHKDKHIRQMQSSGLRDKPEDKGTAQGQITLSWQNGSVESVQ